MFEFTRKGYQIQLKIEACIPGAENWRFHFDHNGHDEPAAQLLLNAIESHMEKRLKATRQDFYNLGYKDGKTKQKRCDWIGGQW